MTNGTNMKQQITIEQLFAQEMKSELKSHQIPHTRSVGSYTIKWYPEWVNTSKEAVVPTWFGLSSKVITKIENHVEYFLTVTSEDGDFLKGSVEAYKNGRKYGRVND